MSEMIFVNNPDNPNRCEARARGGDQCMGLKLPGYNTCKLHTLPAATLSKDKKDIRNFNLTTWRGRVNEFADNTQVKSLREEIGITRLVLEQLLNACNNNNELILASQKITNLVGQIEKLVVSCHKLEKSTGALLDKNAIILFAERVVGIIAKYVLDPEIIRQISDELLVEISQVSLLAAQSMEADNA